MAAALTVLAESTLLTCSRKQNTVDSTVNQLRAGNPA
jgi:hypothetical protein